MYKTSYGSVIEEILNDQTSFPQFIYFLVKKPITHAADFF